MARIAGGEQLNDQQVRAMLLARVRGSVSNSALRDATGFDTWQASLELRALRDRGLLEMQGSGSAVFHTLGVRADRVGNAATADRPDLGADRPDLGAAPSSDRQDLERPNRPDGQDLAPDRQDLDPDAWEGGLPPPLPSDLFDAVDRLGPRARREELRDVIERLCAWRPMTAIELGAVLGLRADNLTRRHLSQMVEGGRLQRTHPENPNHPAQAYRARQIALPPSPKSIDADPKVPRKEAAKSLARFMSLHPHNIAQKTEVIIEHFRQHVRKKIGGRAKAMVVTQSRLHAVRYRQAFDRYLAEKGYKGIGVLVAFSGAVGDPDAKGLTFTEPEMNRGGSEKKLPDHFHGHAYQLLIVANKYQTGFDEPHQLDVLQHKLEASNVYLVSEVEAFARLFYAPSAKKAVTDPSQLVGRLDPAFKELLDRELARRAYEEIRGGE